MVFFGSMVLYKFGRSVMDSVYGPSSEQMLRVSKSGLDPLQCLTIVKIYWTLERQDGRPDLTLVRPTRNNPLLDPVAVQHLYNRLCICS